MHCTKTELQMTNMRNALAKTTSQRLLVLRIESFMTSEKPYSYMIYKSLRTQDI